MDHPLLQVWHWHEFREARDDRERRFSRLRFAFRGGIGGFRFAANAGAAEAPRAEKGNGSVHVQLQDAEGKSIAHSKGGAR